MQYARVGKSGLTVSRLCLGSMYYGVTTPPDEAVAQMRVALDAGINFWDTSNMYNAGRAEETVGLGLRDLKARDRVVLASKVFYQMGDDPLHKGGGRRHIVKELENQLKRLGTDYLDLYYLHRADFETPLEETVETMNSLVQQGKIRYWGTSTFPSWRMAEAWWRCEHRGFTKPICEQSPYNLLDRRLETDRTAFLREYGWGLMTWSSLAGGMLSGKYAADANDRPPPGTRLADLKARYKGRLGTGLIKAMQIAEIAREAGIHPIHLAVAWLLHQDVVTSCVMGPRTVEQMESYIDALEVTLSEDVLAEIDRVVPPGSAYSDFHDTSEWHVGPLTDSE